MLMLLAPTVSKCCTSTYCVWRTTSASLQESNCKTVMELQRESRESQVAVERVRLYRYERLVQGTLQKRYKRFLADVVFSKTTSAVAHAGNTTTTATAAATASVNGSAAALADTDSNQQVLQQQQPAKRRRRTLAASTDISSDVNAAAASPTGQTAAAAVAQDTAVTVVHCPNTGSMIGLLDNLPTAAACSVSTTATRKYKNTLEMISIPRHPAAGVRNQDSSTIASASMTDAAAAASSRTWVGVHSALANKLIKEVLNKQLLPQLGQYTTIQPEVKVGSSRFDFMLTRSNQRKVYVEVKSITLAMPYSKWQGISSNAEAAAAAAGGTSAKQAKARKTPGKISNVQQAAAASEAIVQSNSRIIELQEAAEDHMIALFPDAVSERAQKHVQELTQLRAAGHEAVCIFAIQRNDCCCFATAAQIDPEYAASVKAAAAAGVQMIAVVCEPDPGTRSIWFGGCVPVLL